MTLDRLNDDVRRAVRGSGMTITAVAQASGLRRPHLSDWLHGGRRLGYDRVTRVAHSVGLDLTTQVSPRQ